MTLVIGTDEAGYGPNLGPLVVTATLWEIDETVEALRLFEALAEWVSNDPAQHDQRIVIADSKQIYRSGQRLDVLEATALAAMISQSEAPADAGRLDRWESICDALGEQQPLASPWHAENDVTMPLAAESGAVRAVCERWSEMHSASGIRLRRIRSRIVFPGEWNDLLESESSKGSALTKVTLDLAASLMEDHPSEAPWLLHCDKHGARNKYVEPLQTTFPDYLIEVCRESAATSIYRWGPRDRRVEARFQAKGDSLLPSALASIVSKYVREVSMKVFNTFWQNHVPELRPTAGYPVDAKRFRSDIAAAQKRLHITDHVLWRNR